MRWQGTRQSWRASVRQHEPLGSRELLLRLREDDTAFGTLRVLPARDLPHL